MLNFSVPDFMFKRNSFDSFCLNFNVNVFCLHAQTSSVQNGLIYLDGYNKLKPIGTCINEYSAGKQHSCKQAEQLITREIYAGTLWLSFQSSRRAPLSVWGAPLSVWGDFGAENVLVQDLQRTPRRFCESDNSTWSCCYIKGASTTSVWGGICFADRIQNFESLCSCMLERWRVVWQFLIWISSWTIQLHGTYTGEHIYMLINILINCEI
jgi:hypothetical protein